MKRLHLGLLAVAVLLATSGCVGFLTGSTALTFESTPAKVSENALQETGYEQKTVRKIPMNKTFTYQNQSRTVNVTNWAVHHAKSVDTTAMGEQEAAMFITFTTPQVSLLGQSFNPIGKMSQTELANTIVGQSSRVSDLQKVSEHNIITLSKGTTVTKFEATTQVKGQSVDAYVYMTRVEHNGDYVVAVGVHPKQIDEEQNILKLMRNLEHGDAG